MKRKLTFKKTKQLLLALLFMIISAGAYANCSKPLVMAYQAWEPYQYLSNGKLTGLDIDLVKAIVKNAGCAVTIKQMPWKRHLLQVARGKIDLASGASKTAERENYAYYSDAYRTESAVMFVMKKDLKKYNFKTQHDLIGTAFRLGVTNENYYGETHKELLKNPKFRLLLQSVKHDKINYGKLTKGRINGFLGDPIAISAGLKRAKLLSKVAIHPIKIYADNIFVMFSKKSTTISDVKKFNASLKKLKSNGEYQKIMDKYLK